MAGTPDQKARGAFFTPAAIADYLAAWAVRSKSDTVLEPSCGEAIFLHAAADTLVLHGAQADLSSNLFGVELHAASAENAEAMLSERGFRAQIEVSDFFEHKPDRTFDVILGNPPFVRYQDFTGLARARSMEAALAQGVRLSGLASSWAAFVVKAAQHLSDDGRMALVLPAELLSVGYAAEIRSFLLRRFKSIKLIAFEERVFPGVLEDVVLLLAEGRGSADRFELHQTKNAETLAKDAAKWVSYTPAVGGKWTPALVAADAFERYEDLCQNACETLSDWGRTYLGSVTGNNGYFAIARAEVAERGIPAKDLLPISPPGTRHLRGLTFNRKAWEATAVAGSKSYLFFPADGELSQAALDYIAEGQGAGVAKAYKCRVRDPWWRVPLVETPDILLTYMNHDRPRLIANEAKARILNSLYGVKLKEERRELGMKLLPLACLNSVTLLGAEVVGRAYGGGLLKLEPREADRLPVPSLEQIKGQAEALKAVAPQLNSALRNNKLEEACKLVDPILFPNVTSEDWDVLRMAREMLFQRRRARGGRG
ncbi:MAG: HsdM family class I SAM-dependent methyltransferase [Salipiger thiooxidans]|uniref:HsdM family class I SAM-dependent methyltransferase n=1 Tax=Salipiger thiooxidans TaxID=282683 RepID=UPI001CFA4A0D|nr:N-6 DNA methylase [Salipiger thiooxidans]